MTDQSDSSRPPIRYYPDDPLALNPNLEDVEAPDPLADRPRVRVVDAAGALPPPRPYEPGTRAFLDWQLEEALHRGVVRWRSLLPEFTAWQGGRSTLEAVADEGVDLNAFYDRRALHFFHRDDPQLGRRVWSGESPDVACHEEGHAVLDALRPDLWDAASFEVAAFHEAFGDISALLVVLDDENVRRSLLEQTSGTLRKSNDVSRLAEELGRAARDLFGPSVAPPGCLRDAANAFTYRPPAELPTDAPASHLSREPHSFSRVFTGAFYDAFAALASFPGGVPDSESIVRASSLLGSSLAHAVRRAALESRWMRAVGEAWIAELAFDPAAAGVVRLALEHRRIAPGGPSEAEAPQWDEHGSFVGDLRALGRLREPGRAWSAPGTRKRSGGPRRGV